MKSPLSYKLFPLRSVARVVKKEYEDKFNFVDSCPVFNDWAQRWKKHLAIAMTKHVYNYEDAIFRQGEKAERMYFILRSVPVEREKTS